MALTIAREENVDIVANVAVEIVSTRAGRVSAIIQVQQQGRVWIKGSGTASKDDGILLGGGRPIVVDLAFGGAGGLEDFYEGPISILWEGDGRGPPITKTTAKVRVIEITGTQ